MSTKENAIENAKKDFSALVSKVAKQAMVALDVTDEQVRLDMACNAKEAPMRAHLLSKLAVGLAKASVTEAPVAGTGLSITVVGSASNNAEWLEMAKPFQLQIAELKEKVEKPVVPDAIAVPSGK